MEDLSEAYAPVWEGVVEAYTRKKIASELWKFTAIGYEYHDLLHEGYLIFDYVKRTYRVQNAKHFMALFKLVLAHGFVDLSNKNTRQKRIMREAASIVKSWKPSHSNEGFLKLLLLEMPDDMKYLLDTFLNTPTQFSGCVANLNLRKKKDRNIIQKLKLYFE